MPNISKSIDDGITSTLSSSSETEYSPMKQMLSTNKKPRLHVVCVITHSDGYFGALLQSCILLGIQLNILGYGEPWDGFGGKLRKLKAFCKELDDRDVILILDGFDCILTQPEHVIMERFLSFNCPCVFTAETMNYRGLFSKFFEIGHQSIFNREKEFQFPEPIVITPKDNLNLKYLNAGTMISTVGYYKYLLSHVDEKLNNDQILFTSLYLKNANKSILLDTTCSIFHLWRSSSSVKLISHKEAIQSVPYNRPSKWNNTKSKLIPLSDYDVVTEPYNTFTALHTKLAANHHFKDLALSQVKQKRTDEKESNSKEHLNSKDERDIKIYYDMSISNNKNVYNDNSKEIINNGYYERSSGDVEATLLKYAVLDVDTNNIPCVLHIHCRRNVDWLVKKLGLVVCHKPIYSTVWYYYYSLSSTLRSPAFLKMFLFLTTMVIGMALFLVSLIVIFIQAVFLDYLQVIFIYVAIVSFFIFLMGFIPLIYITFFKPSNYQQKQE